MQKPLFLSSALPPSLSSFLLLWAIGTWICVYTGNQITQAPYLVPSPLGYKTHWILWCLLTESFWTPVKLLIKLYSNNFQPILFHPNMCSYNWSNSPSPSLPQGGSLTRIFFISISLLSIIFCSSWVHVVTS